MEHYTVFLGTHGVFTYYKPHTESFILAHFVILAYAQRGEHHGSLFSFLEIVVFKDLYFKESKSGRHIFSIPLYIFWIIFYRSMIIHAHLPKSRLDNQLL
jgi:hypothetical protein